MPDSNQATQPATYARPPRQRSLAGPVILIAIGIVFLLGNLHLISWAHIVHWFARFWPVLIILWGVIKLLEHFQAQRTGRQATGIGFGGFVLLVFLVFAGLVSSGVERVPWDSLQNEIQLDDNPLAVVFGNSYEFQQQMEQDFPAGASSVRVVSDRGSVTVNTWDQNRIKVLVTKKARAADQAEAARVDQATQAQISVVGNVVNVNTNASSGSNRRVTSNLEIYLPRKAALEISTRRGDVTVHGRDGEVKITAFHSDVTLEDVKGNASITLRHGDVRVSRIAGDLSVDGHISDLSVADVNGSVSLTGDYFGDTNVSKVTKAVRFRSSRTDLELARLDGNLLLQSGDLRATGIAGPVRLLTKSKDIHLDDLSGDLRLENKNGVVEVHPGKQLGSISISNDKGDVRLTLPAGAGFQIEARTRRGEIKSDFADLKVTNTSGESTATGSLGTGAARVQINSRYGNVEIRKG